ncbi:nuclease S(1) [Flavobacteriaceae bacterium UJ101]|nr:nuclease S(1) [Flavobacteriaceae bacterium UJ101]
MNIFHNFIRKKNGFVFICLFITSSLFAWGPTGHRATAEIAEHYLSKKTKRKINKLLDNHDMAYWSTYADAIRSDTQYKKYEPWHYVNYQYGEDYLKADKNPKGDVIYAVNHCIAILKDKNASKKDKAFHLKLLIHFIGDLHQPLHVGHGEDLGGNTLKVEWFWEKSNLHRVWDEGMLDQYKMSYTELAHSFVPLTKEKRIAIQKGTILDWINESKELSEKIVYPSIKESTQLNYRYMYDYFPVVETQIEKGGVRLAKILNEIFG